MGGVYNDSGDTVTLGHTIISENHSSFGFYQDCCTDRDDPFTSLGYNLIGDSSRCFMVGNTTSNILDNDPILGPLQDNGGFTLTHALLPGSPAIDAGDSICHDFEGRPQTDDQRGFFRPISLIGKPICDIGSYEANTFEVNFKLCGPVIIRYCFTSNLRFCKPLGVPSLFWWCSLIRAPPVQVNGV